MSQSDSRVPGRQSDARVPGRRSGGPPPSFGREVEPEPEPEEDFRVVGGQAFHLVLHVEAIPTEQSLTALYEAVRDTTAAGVRDGYAVAIAEMADAHERAGAEETPDGGDGGPSSG